MKVDYHLHTEYSWDSKLKAEDLINKAISLDYSLIAITEHLDLLPYELARWGMPSFDKYVKHMTSLKGKHASSPLRIVCGIEVGDYHRVRHFARDFLAELELELILGAVHFLGDNTNVAIPLTKPLSKAQIRDYYAQNLELVTTCDIDALAHLGVYKRYYAKAPDESDCLSLIRDIFQAMIEKGIALEINFSGLRKPFGKTTPEPTYIDLYRDLGGYLFTIGSDAHKLGHFDLFYDQLPAWLFTGEVRFPI
ncbi:MAG: histidinol-phosphatase HisJ family protein [Candidatus Syntrophosphaera sp.]